MFFIYLFHFSAVSKHIAVSFDNGLANRMCYLFKQDVFHCGIFLKTNSCNSELANKYVMQHSGFNEQNRLISILNIPNIPKNE